MQRSCSSLQNCRQGGANLLAVGLPDILSGRTSKVAPRVEQRVLPRSHFALEGPKLQTWHGHKHVPVRARSCHCHCCLQVTGKGVLEEPRLVPLGEELDHGYRPQQCSHCAPPMLCHCLRSLSFRVVQAKEFSRRRPGSPDCPASSTILPRGNPAIQRLLRHPPRPVTSTSKHLDLKPVPRSGNLEPEVARNALCFAPQAGRKKVVTQSLDCRSKGLQTVF